jgi:hypothetical protein
MVIEIQEPAQITLPVAGRNVLVLNNTVLQPENNAIERMFDGKSVENYYPVDLDSAVWFVMEALSADISAADFFDDVSIYKKPIRKDQEWLTIQPLPKEIQDEFYEEEEFDVLITIDRLLFRLKEDAKKLPGYNIEDPILCDAKINAVMAISCYLYGTQSQNTFSLSDSISIRSRYADTAFIFKEVPDFLVWSISDKLGKRVASKFIPKWKRVDRMFFTGPDARAKEASSYAGVQKWDLAESIWLSEFEKKNKVIDKVRLASNIALANEMQDKFESALKWAEKAEEYLKQTDSTKYQDERVFLKRYINELDQRILNNRLLNIQYGVGI